MAEAKTEKRTLMIIEVEQPVKKDRSDGKGTYQILAFKAKDGNETHTYKTFNTAFFDLIKPEATIEVDVKTEEKGDYVNRSVQQIYQDGKPVAGEKKPWQARADNPEQRTSIERQVAAKIVAELWVAGKVMPADPILGALYHWLCDKLGIKDETQEKVAPALAKPPAVNPEASIAPPKVGLTPGATKPFDSKEFIATAAILADRGMEKWKYDKILERLNKLSGLNHRTVAGGMMKLNEEQRNSLVSELNEDFSKAQ